MSAKIDPSTRRGATEGREPSLLPVWCEACKRTHYAPWCEPVPVAPSAAGEREAVYVAVEDNGHDCQFVEMETKDGRGVSIPSEPYPGQHFMRRIGPLYRSSRDGAGVTEESLATEIFHASVREGLHFGNDLRSDFSKVAARVAIRMMGGGK